MNNGRILGGHNEIKWLINEGKKILFDKKIPTPKGSLYDVHFRRTIPH
jgi:hypothetical protein